MQFAIDAMTVNFHDRSLPELTEFVERWFLDKTIWCDRYEWERIEGGKDWTQRTIYAGGDITIMTNRLGFHSFQVKSRACAVCQENLPQFVNEVRYNAGKFTCSRIDGCWSGMPWSVEEFYQKLTGPELVSRIRTDGANQGAQFLTSDAGETAAFPSYNNRKGANRFLRYYDARGYNRLELELHREESNSVFNQMADSDVDSWPTGWLGYLLRHVDFRTGKDKKVERRKRSEWWHAFVGEAAKVRKLIPSQELPPERTLGQRTRGAFRRNARWILMGIEAAGMDYIMQLLNESGRRPDPAKVEQLKKEWFPPKEKERPQVPFDSETFLPFDKIPF